MLYKKKYSLISVIALLIIFCIISFFLGFFTKEHLTKETTKNFDCNFKASYQADIISKELLLIDQKYSEEKKKIKSNAELTSLNEKYSNIWKEKIECYYELIIRNLTYEGDFENTKSEVMKDKWEEYYTKEINYMRESLVSIYGSGSIVPIKLSEYDMLLNRNKAIELSLIPDQSGRSIRGDQSGDGSVIDGN